jgi:hypothetical protein
VPALVPVPDRATVNEGLLALLATVRFAEAAPDAVGVKVTDAVQEAPAARELPQVLVSANGEPADTDEMEAATVPVFFTVTV